ncbi:MAG: hypothetical protein PHO32_00475 [Candidatus Cloacimonetes bacterium]|nr:hypothetical protein [Candidatus Cloacimonadota bacterium]
MKAILLLLVIILFCSPLLSRYYDIDTMYSAGGEFMVFPFKGEGDNKYSPAFLFNFAGLMSLDDDGFYKAELLGFGFTNNSVGKSSDGVIVWDWASIRFGKSYKYLTPYLGASFVTYYLPNSGDETTLADSMIPIRLGTVFRIHEKWVLYSEFVFRAGDDVGQLINFQLKLDFVPGQ